MIELVLEEGWVALTIQGDPYPEDGPWNVVLNVMLDDIEFLEPLPMTRYGTEVP